MASNAIVIDFFMIIRSGQAAETTSPYVCLALPPGL